MFVPFDHLLHLEGEALARDVSGSDVTRLLAPDVVCRSPVRGTVYATLLNDAGVLAALGDAVHTPPYKAPPNAPVLYVKPRNTVAGHRARVVVPDEEQGVEIGGSLGIVIGRPASRVSVEDALQFVAGYTTVADLCIPHESVYRPSVRFRARDGFCVIGPTIVGRRHVANPDALSIEVRVAGNRVCHASTSTAIRDVARLIADVTEFMTLAPGDLLTLGVPYGMPLARTGDDVSVAIGDWAPLRFSMISTGGAR